MTRILSLIHIFNHADYRLISTRVLESFADYREVNIFLRGMVPLVGLHLLGRILNTVRKFIVQSSLPFSTLLRSY